MSDAQTLPALMNAVLNSSVVDNGAVVVGLLPKHRCCAGGCYEVESKEITHDLKELQDNKHSFKEGVESQEGGAKSQQHRHCLVGIWQDSYTLDDIIMVETVQDKPGYIFGKVICGNFYGNARKGPHFWFKTGDGISKEMEGQFSYGSPAHGIYDFFYLFSFFRSLANWFFAFSWLG